MTEDMISDLCYLEEIIRCLDIAIGYIKSGDIDIAEMEIKTVEDMLTTFPEYSDIVITVNEINAIRGFLMQDYMDLRKEIEEGTICHI